MKSPRVRRAVYADTDPRARHRQLGGWVDRQTHDEFELLATAAGMTKAAYLRQLVERHVHDRVSALWANPAAKHPVGSTPDEYKIRDF